MASMGRPKTHDEQQAGALLDAAEDLVDSGGLAALSVRAVAERSSTTTRAVYSLFGSKAGLVAALGVRMFDLLGAGVEALPKTDRPDADLVEAGVGRLSPTLDHPASSVPDRRAADRQSTSRRQPVPAGGPDRIPDPRISVPPPAIDGQLPDRDVNEAATQFHALCEGLATVERRGMFPPESAERLWREALAALLDGLAQPPPRRPATPTDASLDTDGHRRGPSRPARSGTAPPPATPQAPHTAHLTQPPSRSHRHAATLTQPPSRGVVVAVGSVAFAGCVAG